MVYSGIVQTHAIIFALITFLCNRPRQASIIKKQLLLRAEAKSDYYKLADPDYQQVEVYFQRDNSVTTTDIKTELTLIKEAQIKILRAEPL